MKCEKCNNKIMIRHTSKFPIGILCNEPVECPPFYRCYECGDEIREEDINKEVINNEK